MLQKLMTGLGLIGRLPDSRLERIQQSGSPCDGLHVLYQKLKLNNDDVRFIREDVRQAQAAYPNVTFNQLTTSRWFAFDPSSRVPADGFYNSHGIVDKKTGKTYLESAYMPVVRPEYPNRADVSITERYFAARKERQEDVRRNRLAEDGPFASWCGTGGSLSVRYYKPKNRVTVERVEYRASIKSRWRFPFVFEEWLGINTYSFEEIQTLPSFKAVVPEIFEIEPSPGMRVLSDAEVKEMGAQQDEYKRETERRKALSPPPLYKVGDKVVWRDEKWQWSEDGSEKEYLIRAIARKGTVKGWFFSRRDANDSWWYSLDVEDDDGSIMERNAPTNLLSRPTIE